MPADDLERYLQLIRQEGGRVTTARRAILSVILEAGGHITADEVAERVQAHHPEVHLSTVYRTLDALTDLGVVDHVHLGHGRAVYHLAGEGHQHLVCEECGKVVEAPDEVFAPLAKRLQRDYGFALRPNHFAFTGRCARCA